MAAWEYIGYKRGDGGTVPGYGYWSNGKDVAIQEYPRNYFDIDSDIPPATAQIEYNVVVDEYDGDIIALMDDWRITPENL